MFWTFLFLACPSPAPGGNGTLDGDADTDADSDTDTDTDCAPVEWYRDGDNDGHGDPDLIVLECDAPSGFVAEGDDCDDLDPHVNPDATEVCGNGIDDNCDGLAAGCGLSGDAPVAEGTLRIDGTTPWSGFGVLGNPGDLDGDGDLDLVIGAPNISSSHSNSGQVWVFDGPVTASALDTDADRVVFGGETSRWYGSELLTHADLDGDGVADLAEGSYVAGADRSWDYGGEVAIFFGAPVDGTWAIDAPFKVVADADQLYIGASIDAGDTNGDGDADLLVSGGRAIHVFEGPLAAGSHTLGDSDLAFNSIYSGDALAIAYFDGDGRDDTVVPGQFVPDDGTDAGRVYVVDGGARRDVELSEDADHVVAGARAYDHLGIGVSVGDLDGDGDSDLLVGADGADSGANGGGCIYLFDGPLLTEETPSGADARRCGGVAGAGHGAVHGVVPDLSGDGAPDVVVGAPFDDGGTGAVYLLAGPWLGSAPVESAEAVIRGSAAGDGFGSAIAFGGDLDGDAVADLVVTARAADHGASSGGSVYVIAGGGS